MLILRHSGYLFLLLSLGIFQSVSCKKAGDAGPELKIKDASQERSVTASVMKFQLVLSKAAADPVSVDYSLADGSAVSPANFESSAGTVTIPAGQTEASIDVTIKGDSLRQANLQFTVNLSNPKSCTLAATSAKGTIITENGTSLATDNSGYTTPLTYPGYTLVWSDEFSEKSLNTSAWNQEMGNGSGGWGNNELESYTNSPKNTFISNGNLIIEARREILGNQSFTSGRMTTQDKKTFTFGRIDIRAKVPVGKGIWPALWMLGSNIPTAGWPACGETDIMELIGTYPGTVYGTLHWKNAGGSHASKGSNWPLSTGDYSKEFHVFTIKWSEDNIAWFVDDQQYLSVSSSDIEPAPYPFNSNQFFIFNVAVGGNWPGSPDYTTEFPQRMFVDYIRVFQ